MRAAVLTVALLVASGAADAGDRSVHGDWIADVDANYSEAFTRNESQSSFGILCGTEKCVYYYSAAIRCEDGAQYTGLLAGDAGASSVAMKCVLVGKKYVNVFEDTSTITGFVKEGGTLGLAVALASGKFNVSRFSLQGSRAAITRVLNSASSATGGNRDARL